MNFSRIFRGRKVFFFIFLPLKIEEIRKNRNRPGMTPNSVGSLIKIWLILLDLFHVESTTFCCRNAGTPAARLPRPATSGWPLLRLASPTRGAGQNAGGQGPKAAPPRAREQASRGSRLPRPATSGWPLLRLASPTRGAGQNAGGQGPKAAPPRAREQASRGSRLPRPATSGWPLQSPRRAARHGCV